MQIDKIDRVGFCVSNNGVPMKILMAEFTEIEKDRRILKEIELLEKKGHTVQVFGVTKKDKSIKKKKICTKSTLVSIPYRNLKPETFYFKIFRFLDQVKVTLKLWFAVLFSKDFDLFHAHNALTLPAMAIKSNLSKKPLIYDVHEVWWEIKAQLVDMGGIFEKLFIKMASYVITTSKNFNPIIKERYNLKSPIIAMENYPSKCELKDRPTDFCLDNTEFMKDGKLKFVYLGHLYAQMSGVFNFLDAMVEYENIELHIYGYSSQGTMDELKEKMVKLNLNERVFIHKPVKADEVLRILKLYDIGLIAYKYVERPISFKTYSTTKLYMYLHAGLPVLCTKIESYESKLDEDIVYWVKWDQVSSFKAAINDILNETKEEFVLKKRKCLDVSKDFIWQHHEKEFENVYTYLMSNSDE